MALAVLAGCTAQQGGAPETTPSTAPVGEQASCGADKLGAYLGMAPTADVLAKMKTASGAQAIRVVGPDDAMTMDMRPDRLTIHTGRDGRIQRFQCV